MNTQDAKSDESIRVLVVDGDAAFAGSMINMLQSDSGHSYVASFCTTGMEAIASCRRESFDCVLIEYQLADLSGIQVIDALRRVLDEKTPPIIVVSEALSRDAPTQALRAEATDFLAKADVTKGSLCRSVDNAVEKGRLQRGIQERRRELTLANAELERQAIEIQRFYHTVSHEMKTPLTAAREFVSIVHDRVLGDINASQEEVLLHAMQCCDQITAQFNDLVDLTRLETGKLALDIKPWCLDTLLRRTLAMLTTQAKAKSIDLEYRHYDAMPTVLMDQGRITQVVSNLLTNAIKFTDEGGRIRLALRVLPMGGVQIRVSDTGCGIPKAYLTDVFDRLFQVESADSTEGKSGLGLGLSVAREILRGHGKELRVQSRLNTGSLFTFELDPVNEIRSSIQAHIPGAPR